MDTNDGNGGLEARLTRLETSHDGWMNLFTGAGMTGRDRVTGGQFRGTVTRLDEGTLEDLFARDGFARRGVALPAKELTREWFGVTGDDDDAVGDYVEERGLKRAYKRGVLWARLYGGALVVLGLDDGSANLAEPLREDVIQRIGFAHVFSRFRVSWQSSDLYDDPRDRKFNTPRVYRVTPFAARVSPGASDAAGGFLVHESRCLVMDGLETPERIRWSYNQGWGDSVLQAAWDQLRNLGLVYNGAANIVEDFVQGVMSIENLEHLIASGREGEILKRLQILDMSRSILNTLLISTKETYEKKTTAVSGLAEIIREFKESLAAVFGIPVTQLFGRSAAGMNATGEGDARAFYDDLAADQEEQLTPTAERLVKLVYLAKDGPTGGREPEAWSVEWRPLWQLSDREEAEVYGLRATADNAYVASGVLDPDEVALARFAEGREGDAISIDPASRIAPADPADRGPEPAPVPPPAVDPVTGLPVDPAPSVAPVTDPEPEPDPGDGA